QLLNARVPVETAFAPIGLAEFVGDFDYSDPLGVLVAELGRGAQPQRITKRIADDLAGIFGGKNRLRMQRGRHVDAFGIIVGADEIDIFRGQIGADTLQKVAQIRTGPLADIVPALLLLRQRTRSRARHGRLSSMRPANSSIQLAPSTGLTSSIG